jgi:carbamoyltransferase
MKILSISTEQDAGAAINIDGKIVAAANEERFNRKKLFIGFPEISIKEVCKKVSLSFNDFDYIAVSTLNHIPSLDYKNLAFHQVIGEKLSRISPIQKALQTVGFTEFVKNSYSIIQGFYRNKVVKQLRELGFKQKVYFIDHHTCHGYAAYNTSGFDDCLVITLDGAGDGYCSKVFIPENYKLHNVHKIPFYGSPGYYYSYATNICGFKYGREGKLTGLAAFGNPEKTKKIFASRVNYDPKKMIFVNYGHYFNSEIKFLQKALSGFSKEDIAAGIQTHTEEIVTSYISDLVKKFNKTKIALCGGVFANVKLNQRISEIENIKELYVHPHMGDGGLAVGASFALLDQMNQIIKPYFLETAYLGPEYSDEEIMKELETSRCSFYKSENVSSVMAKAISEGKVVAYFNGAMEYGPRALGNRSIFVSAKDPHINQSLNDRLERSEFMPFAPIIMKEKENDYFKNLDSKHKCNRFMTITTDVKEKAKSDIPAAVHIDGTARFQSITKEQNSVVYKMLQIHEELTGVPAVINTSFNMHEEPIVESPKQAIDCFLRGHLDVLVIGNYVAEKIQTDAKDLEKNTLVSNKT